MGFWEKISRVEGLVALGERLLRWAPVLMAAGASGGIVGWATSATEAFSAYSPLSWVLGAAIGALLFLLAYWIWAAAMVRVLRYRFAQFMVQRPPTFNPLEDTFTKRIIDINAFRTPFNESVRNKTFVECELRGPCTIAFLGFAHIDHNQILNCEFVKVRDDVHVANVIPFENVTIRNSRMLSLTILVPESAANQIPAGATWITP